MNECLYVVWYLFDVGNEKSPKLTKMKMKNNTLIKYLAFEKTTTMISHQNQHLHSLDNHLKIQIFYDKSFLFDVMH